MARWPNQVPACSPWLWPLQDLRRAEVIEAQMKETTAKLEQVQKVAAQLNTQVDR